MDTHDRELRYDALAGLQELLIELAAHTNLPVPKVITVDVHAENDLDGFEIVGRAGYHHRHHVAERNPARRPGLRRDHVRRRIRPATP